MDTTCQLNVYDEQGVDRKCGRMAVSIWKARDGDIPVCEQCEAMIVDVAKGGTIAAIFDSITR